MLKLQHNNKNNYLAVFLPSKTPFYLGLFQSLKKAFTQHGFIVIGGCGFLDGEELAQFIRQFKPTVFFEMNRCKSEIKFFPQDIIHICWLVDLTGRKLNAISGSEVVCFFSIEWLQDYNPTHVCKVEWLPPASDPDIYYPIKSVEKEFKTVFLGHISKPWTDVLLQRVVAICNQKKIIFADVLKNFATKWSMQDSIVNNDCYIQEVFNWLKSQESSKDFLDDKTIRYDIGCRIIRNGRRVYFLDWLLENAKIKPFGIFGGANWQLWLQYKQLYKNELKMPKDINRILNSSKSIIHEGVGFHFRLFDAILSGTPVVIRKSKQDNAYGGIGTVLNEGEDYIAIDIQKDKSKTKLTKILNQPQKLEQMALNARTKVLSNHTWFHRLSQVVRKINEIRK